MYVYSMVASASRRAGSTTELAIIYSPRIGEHGPAWRPVSASHYNETQENSSALRSQEMNMLAIFV